MGTRESGGREGGDAFGRSILVCLSLRLLCDMFRDDAISVLLLSCFFSALDSSVREQWSESGERRRVVNVVTYRAEQGKACCAI